MVMMTLAIAEMTADMPCPMDEKMLPIVVLESVLALFRVFGVLLVA